LRYTIGGTFNDSNQWSSINLVTLLGNNDAVGFSRASIVGAYVRSQKTKTNPNESSVLPSTSFHHQIYLLPALFRTNVSVIVRYNTTALFNIASSYVVFDAFNLTHSNPAYVNAVSLDGYLYVTPGDTAKFLRFPLSSPQFNDMYVKKKTRKEKASVNFFSVSLQRSAVPFGLWPT
jgi:hypothetical protein